MRPEEKLAVTSCLNLHILLAEDELMDVHFTGLNKKDDVVRDNKTMDDFLAMVQSQTPKVVLIVEQESDHNKIILMDRFVAGCNFMVLYLTQLALVWRGKCLDRKYKILWDEQGWRRGRKARHEIITKRTMRFAQAGFRPIRVWYDTMEAAESPTGRLMMITRLGGTVDVR